MFPGLGHVTGRVTSIQQEQPHSIAASRESARCLERDGFDVPTWEDLAAGSRPDMPPMEEGDINQPKHGWHLTTRCTDTSIVFTRVVPSLSEAERAMLRSEAHWLRVHSRACRRRDSSVSTPNRFVFYCVAVSMTCLATGLRALSRECWEEGALLRSPLPPGCPRTFS